MSRQGGLFAVAILVVAAALAIWLRQKEFSKSFEPMANAPAASIDRAKTQFDEKTPPVKTAGETSAASQAPPPDPEFQKWIRQEAKELDKAHINGEAKQVELRKAVAKMTSEQTRQLMLTARNPRSAAGEKILSTYLLVESGSRGRGALAELIQAPLNDKGPHPAHSEEEMKGIRDKSLRLMGIDGLVAQAKLDPSAKEVLARAIPGIEDPFVRAYAEDKLRQLR